MRNLFFLSSIVALCSSCSTLYIPPMRAIPLLDKQGEFQIEAGATTNSLYLDVSGAITKDIAITLNGNVSYRNFSNRYDLITHKDMEFDKNNFFNIPDYRGMFAHYYGEVGLGKINILPDFPMKLEVFGGGGMGNAKDADSYGNYKANYYTFFAQSNFGIKKRVVEAGVSLKISYSTFKYTSKLISFPEEYIYKDNFGAIGFEPAGFVRVGGKIVKAVFRAGLNFMIPINVNIKGASQYRGFTRTGKLDYTIIHVSLGLCFRFGGKK